MLSDSELIKISQEYAIDFNSVKDKVSFGERYFRFVIEKSEDIEVVLICFAKRQTSTIHDHQGSHCVMKVLKGSVMELIFNESKDGSLTLNDICCLREGEFSFTSSGQIHQVANIASNGSVLLNFYSPPFQH